ncbi:cell division protein PerM [Leifsonia sp. RAF41]|uniref:cell division protein PerM n=1 Tax=Leifsonia sp. RAF41 TaxID=3233056 RepID=UPI003F95BC8B
MSRTTVALLAALEALIVAAIGLGICLVPITILWAAQYHLGADFGVVWRSSADIWLVGHGVNLTIALDPQTVAQLGLPAAAVPFQVTIALLGFAALTAGLGVRTGMRAAETDQRLVGAVSALATFAVISTLVVFSSGSAVAQPSVWQGIVLPPFVYAVGIAAGFGFAALRGPGEDGAGGQSPDGAESATATTTSARSSGGAAPAVLSALRSPARTLALPGQLRAGAAAAVRAGTAATAIVIGIAALILALLIFGNYGTIISLYEQLQTGIAGGAALTVGQLAVLPNVVVWIASWLVGPGFAIGSGSSVSPLGTELGPLPGLPVFGVIPPGGYAFGLVGVIVPLLAGFLAAVLLRSRVEAGSSGLSGLRARILTAVGIGVVAGIQLGLLAWWSSGSLGPGRLHDVGPNPWLVGAIATVEVAVAAVIGLVVGGRARR